MINNVVITGQFFYASNKFLSILHLAMYLGPFGFSVSLEYYLLFSRMRPIPAHSIPNLEPFPSLPRVQTSPRESASSPARFYFTLINLRLFTYTMRQDNAAIITVQLRRFPDSPRLPGKMSMLIADRFVNSPCWAPR